MGYTLKIEPLQDASYTIKAMQFLIKNTCYDMAPYMSLSLPAIFDKIKNIPFNPDPYQVEFIKRPFFTMNRIGPGGDCDDKIIALCSYAQLAGIPWKLVAVGKIDPNYKYKLGEKIKLQHVLAILYIDKEWLFVDPTYSFNILGQIKDYDRMVIYSNNNGR